MIAALLGAIGAVAAWFLLTRILVIRVRPSWCAVCADMPPDEPTDAVIQFPRAPESEQ